MPTFHLLSYDGELLFHNDRKMTNLATYEADTLLGAVEAVLQDDKVMNDIYEDYYEGDEDNDQCRRQFFAQTGQELLDLFEQRSKNGEISAHVLVDESEQLYRVLVNGSCILKYR
jgi:hypothetical protein